MIKIGIDAMGGDFAPEVPCKGVLEALKLYSDVEFVLYGDENNYKCFPDIGEYINDAIICATRRINNEQIFYDFKETNYTFIFSLTLQHKYPAKFLKPLINCGFYKGPTFGRGPDIEVSDGCLKTTSTCNSPQSFGNMIEANEFNGGKNWFLAKEVEVFYVEVEKNNINST